MICPFRCVLAWPLLLASLGCHPSAEPRTAASAEDSAEAPTATGPAEGERVVAVVERLEKAAHEEWLEPSGVIVSDVVAFAIVQPQPASELLFAHMRGHPRIGGRPLLLGEAVTFVLPRNWRARDLALEELEGLAFVSPER